MKTFITEYFQIPLKRQNSVQFSKHDHCHSTKTSRSPILLVHTEPEQGWGTAHKASAFLRE